MTIPKPMLALKERGPDAPTGWVEKDVKFPIFVQPKLDGVRGFVYEGKVYGRSGKLIKNKAVQREFGRHELNGVDGELIAGDANSSAACRITGGVLNSPNDETQVTWHVYDYMDERPYIDRKAHLDAMQNHEFNRLHIQTLPTYMVDDWNFVHIWEGEFLKRGFEGLILRNPMASYKHGRGTKRGCELLKLKRFMDAEARVINYEEEMHNANERTDDAWGHGERSSAKAGLVGKGTLGALVCASTDWEYTFKIGTGFSDDERKALWAERDLLVGRVAKFKHFSHGALDRPRHPVFLGWRIEADMPNPEEK